MLKEHGNGTELDGLYAETTRIQKAGPLKTSKPQ
jgi:hypothetical protein